MRKIVCLVCMLCMPGLIACSRTKEVTIDLHEACIVNEYGESGSGHVELNCSLENTGTTYGLEDQKISYIDEKLDALEVDVPGDGSFSNGDEYELTVINPESIFSEEDADLKVQVTNTVFSGTLSELIHDYEDADDIPESEVEALRTYAEEKIKRNIVPEVRNRNNNYVFPEIVEFEPLDIYYVTSYYEYEPFKGQLNDKVLIYTYKIDFQAQLIEYLGTGWDTVYSEEVYDDTVYVYCAFSNYRSSFLDLASTQNDIESGVLGYTDGVGEISSIQQMEEYMLNGENFRGVFGDETFYSEKWGNNN